MTAALQTFTLWLCKVCGCTIGIVDEDGRLLINGREIISGRVRCPDCKRARAWAKVQPAHPAKGTQ